MRCSPRSPLLPVLAALVLLAGPATAYVVVLRDGSQIVAKEKYRVEGNRALIVLPNGTQTKINLSEIDVARSEAANQNNLGTAVVIEDGRATTSPTPVAPPKRPTLNEAIERGSVGLRALPESRREPDRPSDARATRTPAGYPDLMSFARSPYRNTEIGGELITFLLARGMEGAQIFEGTSPKRILLELVANSEASVFRGLQATANAIVHLREKHGDRVEAIELVLVTPQRGRGGQFVLSPQQAADLLARKVELTAFYVENVQF